MWIAFGILAFLAAIIIAILSLSVTIIIRSDKNGAMELRYRFLFRTFGEEPNPNHPIVRIIKKGSGIARIEKTALQRQIAQSGTITTYGEIVRILVDLLREIGGLLSRCTAKKLGLKIICGGEDAADVALNYGACAAVVYPLLGALHTVMRVRPAGHKIEIGCDYESREDIISYDIHISVRFHRVFAAFLRVAYKEAKRTIEEAAEPTAHHSS